MLRTFLPVTTPFNTPATPANVLRNFGLTETTFDMDDASGTPATVGQASLDAGGGHATGK